MAINKSALVGGMGVATTIVQMLVASVKKAGGKEDDIHRLVTDDAADVWQGIGQLIVKKEEDLVESVKQLFIHKIHNENSFASLNNGKWDRVADEIYHVVWTDIPVENVDAKEREVVFKLFPPKFRDDTSDSMVTWMGQEGYRPATRLELLTFGALHPAIQRRYRINALGSTYRSRGQAPIIPVLAGDNTSRVVDTDSYDRFWGTTQYLFLGVGKPMKEISVIVMVDEAYCLADTIKEQIQNLFIGKRLRFTLERRTDEESHNRLCESCKADLVVMLQQPTMMIGVAGKKIPHTLIKLNSWPSPAIISEIVSSSVELKPFDPQKVGEVTTTT